MKLRLFLTGWREKLYQSLEFTPDLDYAKQVKLFNKKAEMIGAIAKENGMDISSLEISFNVRDAEKPFIVIPDFDVSEDKRFDLGLEE